MNKFKVGDRVRIIENQSYHYNQIGTIIESSCCVDEYYKVELDYCRLSDVKQHELELVKERNNNMDFTLSDLTDDMIVEIRNGKKYLVISDAKILIRCDEWLSIDNYLNDLKFNINKVWKIKSKLGYINLINLLTDDYIKRMIDCDKMEIIYDRNTLPKKMTLSQICNELGYDVEIVKE